LNFNVEASNAEKCRAIFKDHDKRVYIPKIYKDLVRERVLVMSFENGIPVSRV
jgi:predicted unusual protein kinase regulating ubiquinone biosynthesis (AarF/ABC1/UbiB family)